MKTFAALLILLLGLVSGAQALPWIEKVYQDLDEKLEAPVGGQVFKSIRREPQVNAFGKADLFGRADDRGYMEVSYRGLTRDGKVVLRIIEVDPKAQTSGSAGGKSSGPLPAGVSALSHGAAIPLAGQPGKPESLPANATEVALDLGKKQKFRFGSVVIAITHADKSALKYSLQQPGK